MVLGTLAMAACSPTVMLEAPEKPVRIDLNIKIDHEVRVKLEKNVDALVKSKPDLF
ncbi:MAG: YnbE family lipoprotein [Alphaproteobacteria bacterium]|nr:YnbE family lipoprotein [Alphaproteobacteria bacterium]